MNQEKLNIAEKEIDLLKIAINDVLQEALLFKEKIKENKFISKKDVETLSSLSKKENTISDVVSSIKTSIEDTTKDDLDIIDIPKSPFDYEQSNNDELEGVLLKGIDVNDNDKESLLHSYESEKYDAENEENINKSRLDIPVLEEVLLEIELYSFNGLVDKVKITTIDELEDKKAKKKALHKAAKSYNKQSSTQKTGNKASKTKQKVKNNDRKTGFIEKLITWFKSKF